MLSFRLLLLLSSCRTPARHGSLYLQIIPLEGGDPLWVWYYAELYNSFIFNHTLQWVWLDIGEDGL